MKRAIFGGAFNPVHIGHVNLAKYIKEKICADSVIIVPSFISPHKSSENLLSGEDRLNMCKIAFEGMDGFEVSDIEISRGDVSYTALTLSQIKHMYPEDEIYLFMGADMFMTVLNWYEPEKIFSVCTVCTVPRDDISAKELQQRAKEYEKSGARCIVLDAPKCDISSSELRQGEKTHLLPKGVYEYIKQKGLYNGKI